MKTFSRTFSTSLRSFKDIKPAFKTDRHTKDVETFHKNFPVKKEQKAWERAGESKDEYFKSRFAYEHYKQKSNDTRERRSHYQTVRNDRKKDDKREYRDQRDQHRRKFSRGDVYQSLQPNPLSEYIYGTSPVLAALQANKRELFNKLYMYNPDNAKDSDIIRLATQRGVDTVTVDSRAKLNALTNNGIHNGYVLETKPLIPTDIFELGTALDKEYIIQEDNFGDSLPQSYTTKNTNPLGIYLDGITDPHNVGAIIRSAYFLGVDFIVMSERNCAPLSPVVAKTAVGATEFLPIFTAGKPLQFFEKSRANGWNFVSAAVAEHHRDDKISKSLEQKTVEFDDLSGLLKDGPCILVLGSEGEGIRTTLKVRSDFLVAIKPAEGVSGLVDSLNVSVAGALLMQKMLSS